MGCLLWLKLKLVEVKEKKKRINSALGLYTIQVSRSLVPQQRHNSENSFNHSIPGDTRSQFSILYAGQSNKSSSFHTRPRRTLLVWRPSLGANTSPYYLSSIYTHAAAADESLMNNLNGKICEKLRRFSFRRDLPTDETPSLISIIRIKYTHSDDALCINTDEGTR